MTVAALKKRSYPHTPPPSVPAQARPVMARIVHGLAALEQADCASPLDDAFIQEWNAVLSEIGTFQNCVITHSEFEATCSRGCTGCCCHWVEDVNSFEAEIIADTLRKRFPHRIEVIRRRCSGDGEVLERLDALVHERLSESPPALADPSIDRIDLLLSVFYQMRRPCPLLDADGGCMVYDVRPLTCRMYLSFSDPLRCDPDYIAASLTSTCIIDLSENANGILDALHFKYLRFEGDTGLRSLLAKYLG